MSTRAMIWAIYLPVTTVHGGARAVLSLLADRASDDGTGAYPSARTLAETLAVAERTVKRHLAELEQLGLIRRGNQARASRLPGNRRPVVWDLAMSGSAGVTGPSPLGAAGVTGPSLRGDRTGLPGVTPGVIENRPEPVDNPPTRTRVRDRARETGGGGTGGAGGTDDARGALAEVVAMMPSEYSRELDPKWDARVLAELDQLLSAGWLPGQIAREVNHKSWNGLSHPSSRLRDRLVLAKSKPAPGSTPISTSVAHSSHGPWCQDAECHPITRLRDREDGTVEKCPKCHRDRQGDAA